MYGSGFVCEAVKQTPACPVNSHLLPSASKIELGKRMEAIQTTLPCMQYQEELAYCR